MVRTLCLITSAALVVTVLPTTLAAQGHPNIAIGLSPESTCDSSDINNVALFIGAPMPHVFSGSVLCYDSSTLASKGAVEKRSQRALCAPVERPSPWSGWIAL